MPTDFHHSVAHLGTKGHQESRSEIGYPGTPEHPVGFEPVQWLTMTPLS